MKQHKTFHTIIIGRSNVNYYLIPLFMIALASLYVYNQYAKDVAQVLQTKTHASSNHKPTYKTSSGMSVTPDADDNLGYAVNHCLSGQMRISQTPKDMQTDASSPIQLINGDASDQSCCFTPPAPNKASRISIYNSAQADVNIQCIAIYPTKRYQGKDTKNIEFSVSIINAEGKALASKAFSTSSRKPIIWKLSTPMQARGIKISSIKPNTPLIFNEIKILGEEANDESF